jgi:phage protein D
MCGDPAMTATAFINVRPTIRVDGEEDSDLSQALSSFCLNLPLNGMAHGELTANNWINTGESGELGYGFQAIGFGKTIEIIMGRDEPRLLFSGEITAVEERYGEGAPQLIILVQDKLHRLARQRNNRVFEDQSPDDIVTTIASELGLTPDVNISTVTATYHQMNESDLAFLNRLAGPYGIALRIDGDSLRARAEEADSEPVALSAQDSALQVRLLADLNHQPVKTVVNGFNPDTSEEVSGEAEALENPPEGITAKEVIEQLTWPGEHIVPQPFARSQGEADAFAQAHFERLAKRFISGTIRCLGEPTLTSGREIELAGVSPRFAGKYQIVHCTHLFDSQNGFETHLKINRADGQR